MTLATKVRVLKGPRMSVAGEIDTAMGITSTSADAVNRESAWLVAITWKDPKFCEAVKTPWAVIDPPVTPSFTDHVTAVLLVPWTVAVKD